ncbi:hypothetical protein [Actinospica sp.]|jgi:hypothetical protein|uniref:hypothetical protein n=1 Tax=Actinospica sp. TaxID=1872142 RepID=UPI002B5C58CE|nr:hypothetical protein [Actinospica sp.]HWG28666.1 hypothetical protein [Actinospica sp.]
MRITLTRASVTMGDDASAPHYADLDAAADATLAQVLWAVDAMRYHHVHAGGWTTWTVYFGTTFRGESSRSLAVMNHHRVAYLEDPNAELAELAGAGTVDLYFEYELGDDPETVRDRLLNGRKTSTVADFTPAAR